MKKRFNKVYLEITNVCNLNCSFCHGTSRAPRFLSCEEFEILAGKLVPYTDYLYLHVMGEPLLHPALDDILGTAEALGLRICITTNGTLLREKLGILLAHAPQLHKLSISLHSAEACGTELLPYLEGCVEAARVLSASGVISALRLWNLGEGGRNAENGKILDLLHRAFPATWNENRSGFKMAEKCYLEWGEKFDWPDLGAPEYGKAVYCYGLCDQLGVLSDGTVVPCCLDSEGDLALGNLFGDELADILASPRALAIVEGFRNRNAPEALCRRCGYATRF